MRSKREPTDYFQMNTKLDNTTIAILVLSIIVALIAGYTWGLTNQCEIDYDEIDRLVATSDLLPGMTDDLTIREARALYQAYDVRAKQMVEIYAEKIIKCR